MKTEEILRKNVRDLQEQLQLAYIKNKELTDTDRIFKMFSVLSKRNQSKVIKMIWKSYFSR